MKDADPKMPKRKDATALPAAPMMPKFARNSSMHTASRISIPASDAGLYPSSADLLALLSGIDMSSALLFFEADLADADYVIAATGIPEIDRAVYEDAKRRNILVNMVDVPEYCDFIFPSVVKRGKLVAGVSSSGASPLAAVRLRKEIEKIIPEGIEEKLDYLFEARRKAKEEIKDPKERRQYLIELSNRVLNDENEEKNK
jgi:siroheme synthase-like protein